MFGGARARDKASWGGGTFESHAETSFGPRGVQSLCEVARNPAASDVPAGDALATPRRDSMSFAANWSSARSSLRAGRALTHGCELTLARSHELPTPQPSEVASADAHGRRVLSASLKRLRTAAVAVTALLSTCAQAHAGQGAPHGVESAVHPVPPPSRPFNRGTRCSAGAIPIATIHASGMPVPPGARVESS